MPTSLAARSSDGPALRWHAGMALPTLDELANACCLVADEKDTGKGWAICTSPADDTCTVDADFSDFYGAPVYVCQV